MKLLRVVCTESDLVIGLSMFTGTKWRYGRVKSAAATRENICLVNVTPSRHDGMNMTLERCTFSSRRIRRTRGAK